MVRRSFVIVALLLAVALPLRAQVAWDSPMLLLPQQQPGFGIFLMDAHGGGLGVMGLYHSPVWNYGLRGGIADGRGDRGLNVFGGIDFSGVVTRSTPDFPLDIDWVFGAGAAFGDGARIAVPVGLTTGHSFRGEGAVFTPYATPRVVFDVFSGDNRRRSTALNFALDIGLDLDLLRDFRVRFAATVGDRSALAVGVSF
jgi:hypothetical protein